MSKINHTVVLLSIIALGFIILAFVVDWLFLIVAVILMIINQKELMKKGKNKASKTSA